MDIFISDVQDVLALALFLVLVALIGALRFRIFGFFTHKGFEAAAQKLRNLRRKLQKKAEGTQESKPYSRYEKTIWKHLGFLATEYGCQYAFQSFTDNYGFGVDTFSFYCENGCFTLHHLVQRGEWGCFVSSQFIEGDLYALLQKEINQQSYLADYLPKRTSSINKLLEALAWAIQDEIAENNRFLGIDLPSVPTAN